VHSGLQRSNIAGIGPSLYRGVNIIDMTFEPKGATPPTDLGGNPRRTRIPWQTPDYDDEAALVEILSKNPNTKWGRICDILNGSVPASRCRSLSSVCSKGKRVMKTDKEMRNLSNMAKSTEAQLASRHDNVWHKSAARVTL